MFRSLEVEYSIFGCIKGEGSRIFDFSKGRDHLGIDEEGGGGIVGEKETRERTFREIWVAATIACSLSLSLSRI